MNQKAIKAFKYLCPERIDVLTSKSIRFTQPSYLNDPFEQLPFIYSFMSKEEFDGLYDVMLEEDFNTKEFQDRLIEACVGVMAKFKIFNAAELTNKILQMDLSRISDPMIRQVLRKILTEPIENFELARSFRSEVDSKLGILSLSQRNDNLTMWSHYGDKHKGLIIEFDPLSDFLSNPYSISKKLSKLLPVKYLRSRPMMRVFDKEVHLPNWVDKIAAKVFLTKSYHWKYEEELRLVKGLDQSIKNFEYEKEQIYLFSFDNMAVKNVYLGVNATAGTEASVRLVLSEKWYAHVRLFKAVLHPSDYNLTFKPI